MAFLNLLPTLCQCSQVCSQPSLPQAHVADSYSTCCPLGPSQLFFFKVPFQQSAWSIEFVYPMGITPQVSLLNFIGFLSVHFFRLRTSLWPQLIPLSSTALQFIKRSPQLSLICELTNKLHPIMWVKDIKQYWFQDQPPGHATSNWSSNCWHYPLSMTI